MKKRGRKGKGTSKASTELARLTRELLAVTLGGTPDRPLHVTSASVVEAAATDEPCLRCGARTRVTDHQAAVVDGQSRRTVTVTCTQCRYHRPVHLVLDTQLAN